MGNLLAMAEDCMSPKNDGLLQIAAKNGKITLHSAYPGIIEVFSFGEAAFQDMECVVDGRRFLKCLSCFGKDEDVNLKKTSNGLAIVGDRYATLGLIDKEFPEREKSDDFYHLTDEALKDMIIEIGHCVDPYGEPKCSSIHILLYENGEFAVAASGAPSCSLRGTKGARFEKIPVSCFALPGQALLSVCRIIDGDITIDIPKHTNTYVRIKDDNHIVYLSRIDCATPRFHSYITKNGYGNVKVDRESFEQALMLMSVFDDKVKIKSDGEYLELSCASNVGAANEKIPLSGKAPDALLTVNTTVLQKALGSLMDPQVCMWIKDYCNPIFLCGENAEEVVLPMIQH